MLPHTAVFYRQLRFCRRHGLGHWAALRTISLYRRMFESFLFYTDCDDRELLLATGADSWTNLAALLVIPALHLEKGRITFVEMPQPGCTHEELLLAFHHTNLRWEV